MSEPAGQIPLVWQSLDIRQTLKTAIAAALKGCPLSREQVVDALREQRDRAGMPGSITVAILEKWAAPSASHLPPVHMIPLICKVTGSNLPLQALAGPLGLVLAGPREQAAMRVGFEYEAKRRTAKRFSRALADLEDAR